MVSLEYFRQDKGSLCCFNFVYKLVFSKKSIDVNCSIVHLQEVIKAQSPSMKFLDMIGGHTFQVFVIMIFKSNFPSNPIMVDGWNFPYFNPI